MNTYYEEGEFLRSPWWFGNEGIVFVDAVYEGKKSAKIAMVRFQPNGKFLELVASLPYIGGHFTAGDISFWMRVFLDDCEIFLANEDAPVGTVENLSEWIDAMRAELDKYTFADGKFTLK